MGGSGGESLWGGGGGVRCGGWRSECEDVGVGLVVVMCVRVVMGGDVGGRGEVWGDPRGAG